MPTRAPTSGTGSRTARRPRAPRLVRTTRTRRPAKSFRDVTCVEIARDGMVYVCDKSSNRIQVFDKSGKFVKEGVIAKNTLGGIVAGSFGAPLNAAGSVWDVAFSNDPQQRFLFVADGQNKKVRVLNRDTLTEVGAIGSGGRYPGQFLAVAASRPTRRATSTRASRTTASACRSSRQGSRKGQEK